MTMDAALVPLGDVDVTATGLVARTASPWLELLVAQGIPSGRWIRLSYRASYLDHLVRPLIRFETAAGWEWDTMPAALFGVATWVGRVPDKTSRILISPVDRPGPFGFEFEALRTVWRPCLLPRAFRNDIKTAFMALGARLINARQETRQALMFARGGVSMGKYERWLSGRHRPIEPTGLDAPRAISDRQPQVRFVLGKLPRPLTCDTALLRSLLSSSFRNWSILASAVDGVECYDNIEFSSRIVGAAKGLSDPTEGLGDGDLVACLDADVSLPDYALPVLAETALRFGTADCFYGDQDTQCADGGCAWPMLKPDWSPRLQAGIGYLGAPVFWRVGKVRRMQAATSAPFDSEDWRRTALEGATVSQVHHIRRIMATCPLQMGGGSPQERRATEQSCPSPRVSIIIPTKDQLHLLKECLLGLLHKTAYPIHEIVIVDNGSEAAVLTFYESLAADPRVKIIRMPGRFNFSAMCNSAARSARGECLVFLNNDISVVSPDWLGPLVAEAMRPDTGAVGARLLFPGGALQHAGVAVGMGGYADHVSHGAPADYAGYLGGLGVTHEVSAVTGACIAVEARKFEAVQGFDEEHLPVELNDIDLCLRLAAAGWICLMRPDSVLIHHQSATRGFSFRPFQRYGRERSHFRETWRHVIRDDPFFHPALSVFSTEPSLDG